MSLFLSVAWAACVTVTFMQVTFGRGTYINLHVIHTTPLNVMLAIKFGINCHEIMYRPMHQHACIQPVFYNIKFGIYSTVISTQLHQTSFIDVPRSPVFAEPNATAEFVWKMKNCMLNNRCWRVKLLTELYDLYPVAQGPIKTITDYNVTAKCRDNSTIITLSIVFHENVLENAEYIRCRVIRLDPEGREIVLTHTVNFTTIEPTTNPNPSTETTSNSESSSMIQSTDMTVTVVSVSDSGCKQRVHFSAFVLCFFVANFLTS